jgi:alanyl-tRNA synthetase
VLGGVPSAYEADLFAPLIEAIQDALDVAYGDDPGVTRAVRIIADHARAVTFMVADGVTPSNEGRGYVARRLLRRAVRYGRSLGFRGTFLKRVAAATVERYTPYYPHLSDRRAMIERVVTQEEARFSETLAAGMERINAELSRLDRAGEKLVPGDAAFALYDTFGFPFELTVEVAAGRGFGVDEAGFRGQLAEQRQRARENAQFRDTTGVDVPEQRVEFEGYERLAVDGARVIFLAQGGERVGAAVASPQEVALVLDRTPFYPERGGQVGDAGTVEGPNGTLRVRTTRPGPGNSIVQFGEVVRGEIADGEQVRAQVAEPARRATMRHHTATHLLHAALRAVLGESVHQAGSLVAPDRLRFDFTYGEPLTASQRVTVQRRINDVIRANIPVMVDLMPLDQAMQSGAVALFDERYGDVVRVVGVEGVSRELCGGTHVARTGDIGFFVLVGESSIGSGLRRIEALAGEAAEAHAAAQIATLDDAARAAGVPRADLPERVAQLLADLADARRRLEATERRTSQDAVSALLGRARDVAGPAGSFKLLALEVDAGIAPTPERLREVADWLRDKLGGPSVLLLGARIDGQVRLLATVSRELVERGLQAGKLLHEVAQTMGGRAGGRPEMAQGGGGDPAKLTAALERGASLAAAQVGAA